MKRGIVHIEMSAEEYLELQLRSYRNNESTSDTLLRLAGLRKVPLCRNVYQADDSVALMAAGEVLLNARRKDDA